MEFHESSHYGKDTYGYSSLLAKKVKDIVSHLLKTQLSLESSYLACTKSWAQAQRGINLYVAYKSQHLGGSQKDLEFKVISLATR